MKNQYRISKINNLYSKIILAQKDVTPEYYANLRKSLILEKLTGILTSEVNFESPDKSYYMFDYEDFKILHSLLTSNSNIQNGIDYLYGLKPFFSKEDEKKIMLTRLIIKIGIDQYLYMSCNSKREISTEIIFFDETTVPQDAAKSLDSYENAFSGTIDWKQVANDEIVLKLSPRPSKIFNILDYLGQNIDDDLLKQDIKQESTSNGVYSFREFFKDTNHPISDLIPPSVFTEPRPMIKCNDGFKFSVQASAYNACEPKLTGLDIYHSFEVLSKKDIEELSLYLSIDNYVGNNNKSINHYDLVPLSLVEQLIETHGGINKEATFETYERTKPSELRRLVYAKKIIEKNSNN